MPNQYTKAKRLGLELPRLSEESEKRRAKAFSETFRERSKDPEYKARRSKAMKLAVQKYPESYTSSNRGRVRLIEKYGEKFQGSWELLFYEWCLSRDIKILRVKEGFPYEYEGKRTYFPDFYLPDFSLYIEIKGYETAKDLAKWRDFPHKLYVVRRAEIMKIKRKEFELLITE